MPEPDNDDSSQTNPAEDIKSAAKTTKAAVQTVKAVKTTVQVASTAAKGASGPVGWVLLAKQLIDKIPILKKAQELQRKFASGAAALIAYLLAMFGMKIVGAVVGFIFGAVTGAPLLLIPVAGPWLYAGWVSYWTAKGWNDPFGTIDTATHPWRPVTNLLSKGKSFASGVGSGAGNAVSGAFSAAGNFITGAASTFSSGVSSAFGWSLNALSAAGNFALSISGLGVTTASAAALPVAGAMGAVAVGGILVTTIVTPAAFFTPEADLAGALTPPAQNQFFTLTKTASATTPLPNSPPDNEVTFTINLTASTNLSGVAVTDNITVQGTNRSLVINNDKNGNSISEIPCPKIIPAGGICTHTFTIAVTGIHNDSVITNTVTATAIPQGQALVPGSASVQVTVGTPANICSIFKFSGSFTSQETTNVNEICNILSRSTMAVSLLRKAGTITLINVADNAPGGSTCGTVNGANQISIYCDMGFSLTFAKYLLIHELGHVLGNYNGEIFNDFKDSKAYDVEGLMPTYLIGNTAYPLDETFAEMFAEYVVSREYNHPSRSWSCYPGGPWTNPGLCSTNPSISYTTFQQDRPLHYNFARDQIFGGITF